jgi:membrane peptidoglycan carboxypeptidase
MPRIVFTPQVAPARPAMDPRVAFIMRDMLQDVVTRGTATALRKIVPARIPVAGKTGTTQAARDAWFIGFSADYVAGVWMGYDDNTPLSGVTGAGLPSDIWHEVMVRVHEGVPPQPLPMLEPGAGQMAARDEAIFSPDNSGGSLIEDLLRGIFGGGSAQPDQRTREPQSAPTPSPTRRDPVFPDDNDRR